MNKSIKVIFVVTLFFVLGAVQTSAQVTFEDMFPGDENVLASAAMMNTEGELLGGVALVALANDDGTEMRGFIGVWAFIWEGLEPGFHGFHIHGVGQCEPAEDFTTAGGHFNPDGTTHGEHIGDLPSFYALENGGAMMFFMTDAFTVEDLMDDDGSAFMIHAGRDNYGNIPERYGEADDATLGAGDAGSRVACGVVEMGMSSAFDE